MRLFFPIHARTLTFLKQYLKELIIPAMALMTLPGRRAKLGPNRQLLLHQ